MDTKMDTTASRKPEISAENEVQGDGINLRHYWHVVLERRWLVLTAFVSVFVLCLIYLFRSTPIYQAVARLEIGREQDSILNLRDALSMDSREQDYLQTQYKNLASRTLALAVISRLGLTNDTFYSKKRDLAKAVMSSVTIAPIRLSRLVDIKVEHADPKKAALIANTLVKIFMEQNMAAKRTRMRDSFLFMQQEASNLEKSVEEADTDLQRYISTNRMVSLEESQNIVQQGLKTAKETLDQATLRASTARKAIEEVERILASGAGPDTIHAVVQNALVQDMKKRLSEQQSVLQGLLKKYKDKHHEVVAARAMIATLESQIREESLRVIESLRNEAILAESQKQNLVLELQAKEQEVLNLGMLRINYEVLRRKAEKSKTFFTYLLQRMQETDILGKDKSQNLREADQAFEPLVPIKPRWTLTILIGIISGVAVSLGLAFFVNYLDDSIKSQDDVETYLRLQFLGYVPNIKTNSVVERDLQAHLHPQSSAAEGFRTIRATVSLLRNAPKYHILAVTSTVPSEGKSLVASNLAIVLAQTGLKTLLVDADLRRPSVHKAFQLQSPVGLSAYLAGKVTTFEEFVHESEVPNLDVVCCGAVPQSPSELVGSKRMVQFVEEAKKKYDRVILDCPPVSAVSDPLVVAAMADGIIFVTKFNKVRREHARKSVQRIQDAGIHILGCVLNDIDFEGKDSYYYSYYYYQNRYYASHYKTEKLDETKSPGGGPANS